MADLIDRQALMDAFRKHMRERLDREGCISEESCKACERGCLWRRIVAAAPTVDAVEVVRCKDCKHMGLRFLGQYCTVWGEYNGMGEEGFCSYGERKEDND